VEGGGLVGGGKVKATEHGFGPPKNLCGPPRPGQKTRKKQIAGAGSERAPHFRSLRGPEKTSRRLFTGRKGITGRKKKKGAAQFKAVKNLHGGGLPQKQTVGAGARRRILGESEGGGGGGTVSFVREPTGEFLGRAVAAKARPLCRSGQQPASLLKRKSQRQRDPGQKPVRQGAWPLKEKKTVFFF